MQEESTMSSEQTENVLMHHLQAFGEGDVEAIMEDVDKLEALAQQTDVEYDGWGTYFQE